MKDRKPAVHTDPVCRMQVVEGQEAARREYDGVTYFFCNKTCARRFMQDPELYLRSEKSESGSRMAGGRSEKRSPPQRHQDPEKCRTNPEFLPAVLHP